MHEDLKIELINESSKEDDEKKRSKSNNCTEKIGAGYAATQTAQKMTRDAAKKYEKPKSYTGNRGLFDDGKAKAYAKQKEFRENNTVVDPYTGDELVLTKHEAKIKYGEDWAKHLAESDHIESLEKIFKDTAGNVWNTVEDIKEIANSEDNIKVTSRKFNNAKRSRSNKEFVENEDYLESKGVKITQKGKEQAIIDEKIAKSSNQKGLNTRAIKNVAKTGHNAGIEGAKNAGATAVTMSGIMNLVSVINGEKSGKEALEDTAKDGSKALATGYAMSGSITVVSHTLSNTSSELIKKLIESDVPGKVITAVIVTGDALRKWGEGEITTQECILEIGEKGLNMATMGYSMAVGQAVIPIPIVGGAIGALVGSLLTSSLYNELINSLQTKEYEHQERIRIISECNEAAMQAKIFRKNLEEYLESYFADYRECFDTALSTMHFSYQVGEAEGVIASANEITRKLGGQVNYDTIEEYKKFLDEDSVDVF